VLGICGGQDHCGSDLVFLCFLVAQIPCRRARNPGGGRHAIPQCDLCVRRSRLHCKRLPVLNTHSHRLERQSSSQVGNVGIGGVGDSSASHRGTRRQCYSDHGSDRNRRGSSPSHIHAPVHTARRPASEPNYGCRRGVGKLAFCACERRNC